MTLQVDPGQSIRSPGDLLVHPTSEETNECLLLNAPSMFSMA